MCGYCASLSSEEFSRVQEESVGKILEISNQPEKIGEAGDHTNSHTMDICI